MNIQYIAEWQRLKLTCNFCNENKSVKYAFISNGSIVACCNKCAYKLIGFYTNTENELLFTGIGMKRRNKHAN